MEAGIWAIWDRNPASNELKQTNMYKVGDKVRVRSDLKAGNKYGDYTVNNEMAIFKGRPARIMALHTCGYRIDLDDMYWVWTPERFEDNPSNKLFKLM